MTDDTVLLLELNAVRPTCNLVMESGRTRASLHGPQDPLDKPSSTVGLSSCQTQGRVSVERQSHSSHRHGRAAWRQPDHAKQSTLALGVVSGSKDVQAAGQAVQAGEEARQAACGQAGSLQAGLDRESSARTAAEAACAQLREELERQASSSAGFCEATHDCGARHVWKGLTMCHPEPCSLWHAVW